MDDHQEAEMTNKEQTYDVSNVFRKGETQNGEHALEWIFMLINSVIHVPPIIVNGTRPMGRRESDTYDAKRSGLSR